MRGMSLWFNLNFLGHDLNLGLALLKVSMLELISCPKAKDLSGSKFNTWSA